MLLRTVPWLPSLALVTLAVSVSAQVPAPELDYEILKPTQFSTPLPHFAGNRINATKPLMVTMQEFQQNVLPEPS